MTAGLERSLYDSAPVELFEFVSGATAWRYTSADETIAFLGETYAPRAGLSRGEISHTQEQSTGSLEVTLPRTDPLVARFIGVLPPAEVRVTIRRVQRQDLQGAVLFTGTVSSVQFAGWTATLKCVSLEALLSRNAPGLVFQPQCNWILYGSGCRVSAEAFRDDDEVTAIERLEVVVRGRARRPDGWYRAGWIANADGERRFITAHVGERLSLNAPFRALVPGAAVSLFAGCQHNEADCKNKFDNLARFLGFPRMPARNPFTGTI